MGASPSAKLVKQRCYKELNKLKKKRGKKALASKKLIFGVVNGGKSKEPGAYVHKKSAKAHAVMEFLEDVSVDMPGKHSVDKKSNRQKKVLPKRLKRLISDLKKKHPNFKVSQATFYCPMPSHIVTATKQVHRQCLCEVRCVKESTASLMLSTSTLQSLLMAVTACQKPACAMSQHCNATIENVTSVGLIWLNTPSWPSWSHTS